MTYLKKDHFKRIIEINLKTTNLTIERLSSNAVKFNCDECSGTIYIDTIIYLFDKTTRKIAISNGGWATNTTKKWINKALGFLSYAVFQKNFDWYIRNSGKEHKREEGLNIDNIIFIK